MKKKIIAVLMLAVMLLASMISCADSSESDLEYVLAKDKMVIGITYYAPMDYKDENGQLIGFDAELAAAVCDKLGVTPVFQEINWKLKETELSSRTIDIIWNGLTVDADRAEKMSLTKNYMLNKQVIVMSKTLSDSVSALSDLTGKTGAAESGSAGETILKSKDELKDGLISAADQASALLEVKAGTSDYCIIDAVMANYMVGTGTDYAELTVRSDLLNAEEEYYAAACRKDSDLTAKINEILADLYKEGKIAEIAAKYGLSDVVVPIEADGE